ncbi:MAG: HypC/HybG/HupF family hydrogenase formation chaperone [Deltaproteobacteria bacterium HGW-Deltaproteobacteria-4]|nr:MAG: HypC/HybG/HupF family hydrogenase formation chaperone [Deltaproteobacteria bacterium HGW-Deltaproteobacteria-4]
MCLAVPMRVVTIDGEVAICEIDGVRREANLMMIDGVTINDYVLIHAGFAIEKLDEKEAEETLRLMREVLARGILPE